MADWSELKRLAEAEIALREIGKTADGEPEWIEAEELFDEAIGDVPKTFLALIAENEELAERIRLFDLIHGCRATELVEEVLSMRAEVRRLKILAGEPVPPLPEEFVGPRPEPCAGRIRRKIKEQGNG